MVLLSSNQLDIPTAAYMSEKTVYPNLLFSYFLIPAFVRSRINHTFIISYLEVDICFCLLLIASLYQ